VKLKVSKFGLIQRGGWDKSLTIGKNWTWQKNPYPGMSKRNPCLFLSLRHQWLKLQIVFLAIPKPYKFTIHLDNTKNSTLSWELDLKFKFGCLSICFYNKWKKSKAKRWIDSGKFYLIETAPWVRNLRINGEKN